ncbi:hypothetical protein [Microbacterium sp.]|uniref:hypothetical protein n=1 Tax=Microbacterium sp. TaxID=51671 RepID=UPI0039E36C87
MSPKTLPNPYESHPDRSTFALQDVQTPADLAELLDVAAAGYARAAAQARRGQLSIDDLLQYLGEAFPAAEHSRQLAGELAMERYGRTQRQVANLLKVSHNTPYRWRHNPLRRDAANPS